MFSVGNLSRLCKSQLCHKCYRFTSYKGFSSKTQTPWNVVFFGTDYYSQLALGPLLEHISCQSSNSKIIRNLGLCSRFAEPACDFAKFVRTSPATRDLPYFNYSSSWLPDGSWDLGVVASFGSMLSEELIEAFPYGILCIHPSLLPRWRGASPILRTILEGDPVCGVSLMNIKPDRFDVGPILSQKDISLPEKVTSRRLGKVLMAHGVDLLWGALGDLRGTLARAKPQSAEGLTYAKKIKLKETLIDFSWTTIQIDRFYRALHEDFDIRTQWEDEIVKLSEFIEPEVARDARIDELVENPTVSPGDLFFHKKRNILFVKCADGWVGIQKINIPNRKPMTAKDFYNGFLSPDKNRQNFFRSSNSLFTVSGLKSSMKSVT